MNLGETRLFTSEISISYMFKALIEYLAITRNSLNEFSFLISHNNRLSFASGSAVKNPPARQEMQVQSLGWEDPLGEGMATHSSILAWRMPWTEESGGLQSLGSQ